MTEFKIRLDELHNLFEMPRLKLSSIISMCCMLVEASGQRSNVKLFEFRNSTCNEMEEEPFIWRDRIIKQELKDGILTVELGAGAVCCATFTPKIAFRKDTLLLDVTPGGEMCECSCCYEFVFRVKGLKNIPPIKFRNKSVVESREKYETFPVIFELEGKDTINLLDKYRRRQGRWKVVRLDSLPGYIEYLDNHAVKLFVLYPDNKIKSIKEQEDPQLDAGDPQHYGFREFNHLVEYYDSGGKRRECRAARTNSYEKGTCKEWNEKGQLIYEGAFRN